MFSIEVFTVESYDGAGKGLISADGISGWKEQERGCGAEHERVVRHPGRENVLLSGEGYISPFEGRCGARTEI